MLKALTADQKAKFERDGFLVFRGLLGEDEVRQIKEGLARYIREGLRMLREGKKPEGQVVKYQGVLIQLEPMVVQGRVIPEDPLYAARKVWRLVNDPFFWDLATDPRLLDIVEDLIGPDIKFYADKAMLKPPKIGVAKPWHQDAPYFPIEPKERAHIAVWIALDEATPENGCLQYIPGSHKWGNITTETVETEGLGHLAVDESKIRAEKAVMVEAKPGDVVFHDGLVLHYSAPNRSEKPRWALIFDYISAKCRYTGKDPKPSFPLLRGREYEGRV